MEDKSKKENSKPKIDADIPDTTAEHPESKTHGSGDEILNIDRPEIRSDCAAPKEHLDDLTITGPILPILQPQVLLRSSPGNQKNLRTSRGEEQFDPFNERYCIGTLIGHGGMGTVHSGWDLQLQRLVAIKIIRQDRKDDLQYMHRFLREARIASRLRHPGILGIHDFNIDPYGSAYIVMDFITGRTLGELIEESTNIDSHRISMLTTFLQICQAMAFAHSEKVVHRDLKPANIMIGDYGLATVLDWGLAKLVHPNDSSFSELLEQPDDDRTCSNTINLTTPLPDGFNTAFGTVMGTPNYLAPEQARGDPVDCRSDVFSLGAILCHILTGSPPFIGDKPIDAYQQSVSGDVSHALGQLDRCGAPISVVRLAKQCLSPDPDSRPADASFLVDTLRSYLESGQRRAEEELVRFFDLSLDLFCIASVEGYFCRINENFTKTLGYTSQELTTGPFIEFVHPHDRPKTLDEITKLSRGEPTIQFRNRYRHKNGAYIWLEWTARSLEEEGVIYAVARDISERVQMEEERARIESDRFRLSEIVESASDAIIGKSLDGVVQTWNRGAEKMFGYTAVEMIGNRIHQIIPPERLGEEDLILARVRNGERVDHFETVRHHKNGDSIDISLSVSPIRNSSGDITGASKIARCINKQRELETELERSRNSLIEFAENANIPLHCVDHNGTIIWANQSELKFLGYSRHEYVGQPIAKFHASQDAIAEILQLLSQGSDLSHYVARLIAKDGTLKDVAIYSSAFQENGKFCHTRCFTIDLKLLSTSRPGG